MLADIQQHAIMHLAAILGVAALAFRNQLRLRAVLLASISLNIIYNVTRPTGPSYDDLFWTVVTLLTNLTVLIALVFDRTHVGLTDEEERLFQAFGSLSPGEFRKLLKLATWTTAQDRVVLTVEGVKPDRLFYILEGGVRIEKFGRHTHLSAPTFIGEVAFVKGQTASATVSVDTNARYLTWSTAALDRYFEKRQGMRVAIMRLLSADMANKVARA